MEAQIGLVKLLNCEEIKKSGNKTKYNLRLVLNLEYNHHQQLSFTCGEAKFKTVTLEGSKLVLTSKLVGEVFS